MRIKLNLATPCCDCGTEEGLLNNKNVRPTRLNVERFGFPPGSTACRSCYDKHRARLKVRIAREIARAS